MVKELLEELELLRIDEYDEFERANKMLDDCIKTIKIFYTDYKENKT